MSTGNHWNYMLVSILLKCPCNNDKGSRESAFKMLNGELKKLSPAFIHEISKIKLIPIENLKDKKEGKSCSVTDQRDCGCG